MCHSISDSYAQGSGCQESQTEGSVIWACPNFGDIIGVIAWWIAVISLFFYYLQASAIFLMKVYSAEFVWHFLIVELGEDRGDVKYVQLGK